MVYGGRELSAGKLGNFLSASIQVPTFHVPARSFFFSAESFSNNWEIAMENLLNPVDPVVHGQVVHRRSRRSHFFCGAILHLSSFVFNWGKKRKKRKERKGSLKFPRRPIFPVFFLFTIIKNGYTICFISIPFLPSSYLFFSSSSSLYTFCCKHESFPAITL